MDPPQLFDMCGTWVAGETSQNFWRVVEKDLSTLEYRSNAPPATRTLDVVDLQCPPSNVAEAYNSDFPYFPILVVDFFAKENFARFEWAAVRDPPVHAHRVKSVSGRKGGGDDIP